MQKHLLEKRIKDRLYYNESLIIQILRNEENVNGSIGTGFAYLQMFPLILLRKIP